MSYILDALRKSAEERRKLQEQNPLSYDPLSIAQGSRGRKNQSRPGLLVMCLLLAGLLAGGWFYYSRTKPDKSTLQPQSSAQRHPEQSAADVTGKKTTDNQPAAAAAETTAEPATPAQEPPVALKQIETPVQPAAPQPGRKEAPTKISAVSPAAVPLLKELPFAVQAAIPEMKFSGHVFSPDPRLRLVMVNTSIVREGDMITPDIKLVEITDNGLVFSYRQTPFKIVLF